MLTWQFRHVIVLARSKAKSPSLSSIAYRSKAITPPRSGGFIKVAEVEIAEAREAGVGDPSYPDAEPAQVTVVVSDRVYPISLYRTAFLRRAGAYPVPYSVDSDLAERCEGRVESHSLIGLALISRAIEPSHM
ncbi:hypothetical protein AMTR_s00059p00158120 [Amborella trichopoda]|uniref:Uncharacterized protein n=1 Tax=Amborella trichopoda TaxID=13333 RepID=U5D5V7_AMBTC|nr:hypothetical protein AMTR_s00059p00158120 [Amborella trichopoda]